MAKKAEMTFSERAKNQLEKLISASGNNNMIMRVSVSGGGCSGFQYHFDFNQKILEQDLEILSEQKLLAVIDEASHNLLRGSEIDYVDELGGSYFKINNPNASSTCGCGSSFSM